MKLRTLVSAAVWALVSVAGAAEPPVTIENAWLKVSADAATGVFQITEKAGGRLVARDGRWAGGETPPKLEAVDDKTFGVGQAITAGNSQVMLFPELPFALMRGTVANDGPETSVLNKIPLVSAAVLPDQPADGLRLLGTGGLADVNAQTGSYMWLAIANPQTRQGVVGGWLTTARGSGIVFGGATDRQARLEARVEYGCLRLRPGRREVLETFAIGYFADCRLGLEAYADAIVKIHGIRLPPQPVGHCTWYYARASNETDIRSLAAFAKKELVPFGFGFVQIDDGWQSGEPRGGPAKDFSMARANGPYKSGMRSGAEQIRNEGLTPGLWLIPFAGTWDDPVFANRQDWFAKRQDGEVYKVKWGGSCFDLTRPEVLAYVRDVVRRIVKDWGFAYLKLDGLWTGAATGMMYINDVYRDDRMGDAVLSDPWKTNIEAYRDGLKAVREAAGPETFVLGCNVAQNMRTYGASFGLVDAMRVGPDNAAEWLLRGEYRLLAGPKNGSRNYFLNRRVWYNDPDPVFVRASMPLNHARLICSWVALSGNLTATSDNLLKLAPERLDILKRIMPSHRAVARPVDLFEAPIARLWLVTDTSCNVRRDVVGVFNWDETPLTIDRPLENIGLSSGEHCAFDFWGNRFFGSFKDRLQLTVPPQSCVVLSIRPTGPAPRLLGTSRHVTQGMVDVSEESWDPAERALTGISQVVANDPYELRIALPRRERGQWTTAEVAVSGADSEAGVTIEQVAMEAGLARVRISAPESRSVKWRVEFAHPTPAEKGS